MKLRNFERARLIYYLRVFDAKSGELIGHLADINTQGMMVICEKPGPLVTAYSLRMDLPKNLMEGKQISFEVTSKWCRKDVACDFYMMGFGIDEIGDDDLAVIRSLMRDFYQEEIEDFDAETNPQL